MRQDSNNLPRSGKKLDGKTGKLPWIKERSTEVLTTKTTLTMKVWQWGLICVVLAILGAIVL